MKFKSMRYQDGPLSKRRPDSDTRFMATLWYLFTVFNKNRYLFSVNTADLSEIDFKKYENTNDIR